MQPIADPEERAISFICDGRTLLGVLSGANGAARRGVLVVVGGPQYRVGSHRQFTLLCRHLANHGVPALRFDYRGMGDSEGDPRSFETVNADIRSAIDEFFARVPSLEEVAIWALCDAASAALFYAHQDARVGGLILLNPWVRTAQGAARAHLRHYYLRRLFQSELWRKLAGGHLGFRETVKSLAQSVSHALGRDGSAGGGASSGQAMTLPQRMADSLERFRGRVLVILSGNDLTAQEFEGVVGRSQRWRRLLADPRVSRLNLPGANHTFSRREWRDQVARWTETWLRNPQDLSDRS